MTTNHFYLKLLINHKKADGVRTVAEVERTNLSIQEFYELLPHLSSLASHALKVLVLGISPPAMPAPPFRHSLHAHGQSRLPDYLYNPLSFGEKTSLDVMLSSVAGSAVALVLSQVTNQIVYTLISETNGLSQSVSLQVTIKQ